MPPLSSATDVRYELDKLHQHIHLEETEETWDKIAKALQELIKLCENGAYDRASSELVAAIRTSHRPIVSAMNSERTRLCLVPMDLMSTLASVMGTDFEQLLPLFMPTLLATCARTNKVIVNRAKAAILTIIESAQLAPVLTYFLQNIKDKSSTLKVVIAEGTLACLNSCNPPDFEKEARAVEVESIIRITARDANADVRKLSRKVFESYKILLPSRVQNFITPLSPTTKKYLDVKASSLATQKSVPNLRAAADMNSKRPEPKASSSSTTLAARSAHSRTTSSSTVSTTRSTGQQPTTTTITRVSRKEPAVLTRSTTASAASSTAGGAPAPYVPVRPTQPSRVMTTDAGGRQRTTSTAQRPATTTSGPSRPLRSQPSIISRSTTTTGATSSSGAQRIQKDLGASTSQSQQRQPQQGLPSTSTGPRRIPMPPPPPPAPKKDASEGPKRPSSRVDKDPPSSSTASTRQPVVPPAPVKKKTAVSSLSSSLRDKAPVAPVPTTAGGHARSKSTVVSTSTTAATAASKAKAGTSTATTTASTIRSIGAATGGTSTTTIKPLVVTKVKPQWGSRPAPPVKPPSSTSATSTTAGIATKGLVRKPSSRVVSNSSTSAPAKSGVGVRERGGAATSANAKVATKRPVTPAQIALPPSPTPEEAEEEEEKGKKVQNEKEEKEEEIEAVKETKASSQRSSPVFFAPPSALAIAEPDAQQEQEQDIEETGHADAADADAVDEEPENQAQTLSRNATPTPDSERVAVALSAEETEGAPAANENDNEDAESDRTSTPSSRQPLAPVPSNPQTPQQNLLVPPSTSTSSLVAKTPISALLSSIERGFQYDYSPITPLSPAENYLPNLTGEGTPYSHATHAPHRRFPLKEGPVQPFNHALHVMGHNGMFEGYGGGGAFSFGATGFGATEKKGVGAGKTGEGGELGVVPVPVQLGAERMYAMPVGLPGLDDGRLAFVELNNTTRS